MHPFVWLAALLATVLHAAPFTCAPTEIGGHLFDFVALEGVHSWANAWAYSVSLCNAMPPPIPAGCASGSLSYQVTSHNGECFSLGRKRGAARLAAAGDGGALLEVVGGDTCGTTFLTRRAIVELTCGVGATAITSVDEGCGPCCYRIKMRSSAGCSVPCPVDPRTQLVCGGPDRGTCSIGGRISGSSGGDFVAKCDCALGFSGDACSQGGAGPTVPQEGVPSKGPLQLWMLPLACLSFWWLVERALKQTAITSQLRRHALVFTLLLCTLVAALWDGAAPGVAPRLQSVSSKPAAGVGAAELARAVNLIAPALLLTHHPVFFEFAPYAGVPEAGFVRDFLGMRTAVEHMCNTVYMLQGVAHPLRVQACLRSQWDEPGERVAYGYPIIGEEYAEYVNILQSVLRFPRGSSRPYAMIEVGCGYCHWAVSAALAARSRLGPEHPIFVLGFDGGSAMVARCAAHFAHNQVAGVVRHSAVVNGEEESVAFSSADSYGGHSGGGPIVVPSTNFARIFKEGTTPRIVDIVDVDIQGGEESLFDGHMELLGARVKLVQIGTHGDPSGGTAAAEGNRLEKKLKALFEGAGWEPVFKFHRQSTDCLVQDLRGTPWGPVCFADGSMSFENPRLRGL
jgi:hypothetical protein